MNKNLLSVSVDLSSAQPSVDDITSQPDAHPNDVRISGYSDQILRFIAERGDGKGLLTFVENIHVLYDLEAKLKAAEGKEAGYLAQEAEVHDAAFGSLKKKAALPAAVESTPEAHVRNMITCNYSAFYHVLRFQVASNEISGLGDIKNRDVRVFISSTFKDMHGERDVLTRFVLPELRARASKMHISITEGN